MKSVKYWASLRNRMEIRAEHRAKFAQMYKVTLIHRWLVKNEAKGDTNGQEHTQTEMIHNHFLLKSIYSLTHWLCQVMVVAPRSFTAARGRSGCGVQAWLLCSKWGLSSPARVKSISPALQGRQPGKSQ